MAAGVAGLGFVRLSHATAAASIRAGALVPILAQWDHGARDVSALYLHGRTPAPATRAFVDFAVELFRRSAAELARPPTGRR